MQLFTFPVQPSLVRDGLQGYYCGFQGFSMSLFFSL